MATLQSIIANYGYFAVFFGCFFEGETVLVLAGFAAHAGYLSLPAVMATAAAAGFCGDEVFFALGRRYGQDLFRRFPALKRGETRIRKLVERFGAYAAFGVRFLVGLRIAGPIVMGAGRMPAWKYSPANALGAVTWAGVFSTAGYLFGQAFTNTLSHARHYEEIAFAVIAIAGVVTLAVLRRRAQRND
jgi:membrane protein DedA with SNARE-associated domain